MTGRHCPRRTPLAYWWYVCCGRRPAMAGRARRDAFQSATCGLTPTADMHGAEHAIPVRRADPEAALVVLEVMAHVQLPQPLADPRARRVVMQVVMDHVVSEIT